MDKTTDFVQVEEGVYLLEVPFGKSFGDYRVSVTLVRGCGRENTALVDSGEVPSDADEVIIPALERLGLKASDVGFMLLTHSHGDHTGSAKRFREISGCKLLSEKSGGLQEDGDGALKGGDVVAGLTVCPMPGHSPDSLAFLHEKTGTLITGDCFQACGTGGCGLPLFVDMREYFSSIDRAAAMKVETIIAGHAFRPFGAVIRGKEIDEFFATCMQAAEFMLRYVCRRAPILAGKNPDKIEGKNQIAAENNSHENAAIPDAEKFVFVGAAEGKNHFPHGDRSAMRPSVKIDLPYEDVERLTYELIDRLGHRYEKYIAFGDGSVRSALKY